MIWRLGSLLYSILLAMFMCQWIPAACLPGFGSPPPVLMSNRIWRGVLASSEAEVVEDLELSSPEAARPVALLAGLRGRAEVRDRGLDGARVGVGYGLENLARAGQLRLDIPACAGADVALHATDPCVRRVIVGDGLRVHHGVAELAAEGRGIGELIGAIAADGAEHDEDHHEADEEDEAAAVYRVG